MDIVLWRTGEGQVGKFEAFCFPILNGGLVEVVVLGGDEELGSSEGAVIIVP